MLSNGYFLLALKQSNWNSKLKGLTDCFTLCIPLPNNYLLLLLFSFRQKQTSENWPLIWFPFECLFDQVVPFILSCLTVSQFSITFSITATLFHDHGLLNLHFTPDGDNMWLPCRDRTRDTTIKIFTFFPMTDLSKAYRNPGTSR